MGDNEEDFYDSIQLLDDLKMMADLIKENIKMREQEGDTGNKMSQDSELLIKKSSEEELILAEERLKRLRSFGHFTSTKLQPLDLDIGNGGDSVAKGNANTDNMLSNGVESLGPQQNMA